MKGKRVCYLHGGKSPGAAKGNKHAVTHGRRTRKAIEKKRAARQFVKDAKKFLEDIS